ncbi:hypothetical protein [Marinobacterium aestuariivivens]|uniref:Uncharacterized protein n=1 Tax=Marinobacterium aestuariivivens TaxID=1698799 RepID=A0ABW2A6P3_9GAMM
MADIAIAEAEWQSFCEQFTRQHHGWRVRLHQAGTGAADPKALFTGEQPLQEVREGTNGNRAEIIVTVGEGRNETSFLIEDAIGLYALRIDDAHRGLRIDSGDGTRTLLEFRAAAAPEALDGLADSER